MKESIIKISTPTPKVQVEPPVEQLQSQITQAQEINSTEKLQQLEPELETVDIVRPASMSLTSTNSSGWKVSDILREIRLDDFEMGDVN